MPLFSIIQETWEHQAAKQGSYAEMVFTTIVPAVELESLLVERYGLVPSDEEKDLF
jgi:hypothetical protein